MLSAYSINSTKISVEKSIFIGLCYKIEDEKEVRTLLDKIKKDYPKARHYCYAYKINEKLKYSDDGEPSGTAGKPIYETILNKGFDHILVVIIRYFGGTLLGSGRLLRTYVECATKTIDEAQKLELEEFNVLSLEIDYKIYYNFKNYAAKEDCDFENIKYEDKIFLNAISKNDLTSDIKNYYQDSILILNSGKIRRYREI